MIDNEEKRIRRMRQIMPEWKVAEFTGEGDQVYGEMDPESGLHAGEETEVIYSEEEDPGIYL